MEHVKHPQCHQIPDITFVCLQNGRCYTTAPKILQQFGLTVIADYSNFMEHEE